MRVADDTFCVNGLKDLWCLILKAVGSIHWRLFRIRYNKAIRIGIIGMYSAGI